MSVLITVPTFTFNQGDPFMQELGTEFPIRVEYYQDGIISLVQDRFDGPSDSITISGKYAKDFFKAVLKHIPEAEKHLGGKQ